jgi:hypothetical protein
LNYRLNRSQFYENLHTIVNDETSLRRLLNDKDLMERMASEASIFYNKLNINNISDGASINLLFPQHYYDPYMPNESVIGFITNKRIDNVFVRVLESNSQLKGRWLMRKSDIQGLTPLQIKDKFGLDFIPDAYSEVSIPEGIPMREGIANAQPQWNANGGGVQLQIVLESQHVSSSWFSASKSL